MLEFKNMNILKSVSKNESLKWSVLTVMKWSVTFCIFFKN